MLSLTEYFFTNFLQSGYMKNQEQSTALHEAAG